MSSGGGSRGNGAVTVAGIPAGSRKMVQSLKEIVNLPEQEIYATLKDCGMDPNEAVQRLLSQDSFHEVKSKRDKKKEVKELPEFRTRPNNNSLGRGVRVGSDRGPQPSFTTSSSTGNRGKTLHKKDDGTCNVPSSTNMGSYSDGNRRSTIISENVSTENLFGGIITIADGSSMHTQSSSGYQHGWNGMPGHFSMADVVKMGRSQGKLSRSSIGAGNASNVSRQFTSNISKSDAYSGTHDLPLELDQSIPSQAPHHQAEDNTFEPRATGNNFVSHDTWSAVTEPNPKTTSVFLDTSGSATSYADISMPALVDDGIHHRSLHDEIPEPVQSIESNTSVEQSISSEPSERDIDEHSSEGEEVNEEVLSAATNLHDIHLDNDGLFGTNLEENPAVIIPKHLQVTSAECSHLSFGSFCSGVSTSLPGSLQPKSLHSSSEVIKVDYVPPLDHSNAGNSDYYDNTDLKSQRNEEAVSRGGMNRLNYEISSVSEPDANRDDAISSTHEHQYNLASLSGYGTSTTAQPSSTSFSHPQTNLQLHNLSSLSNLMQPYTGSLPSSVLSSTLPLRDLDLPFSSFLTTQSMSTKHNSTTSNNGPAVPMQEAKPSVFSNPQSSPNSNIPTGHSIPQHLPLHPYPQPTLPLGPYPNLISYPFLPQSYTYMPSAAFHDHFHQSPSPMHNTGLKYTSPQYKNTLPQQTATASGYGNFSGSSNNPPVNFSLNPSTTSAGTNSGFAETLSAQYKEGTHYLPLQQNESSPPMWVHGGSSRTVSPLPPNTFYGFQGQNQLISSFRQGQQPSNYGQMGYLNFFQNQLGGQSGEQTQNTGEVNLNGSHGNPIWQHGY